MLNSAVHKSAYEQTIDALGVPMIWVQTKAPNSSTPIIAGLKIANNQDEAIIQSYGVGARIVTVKAADFPVAPEKFDKLLVGAETLVTDTVHPVHLNAILVGYRLFIRGRG